MEAYKAPIFNVGDIVHVCREEPTKEVVNEMGLEFSEWMDENQEFAGQEVVISEVLLENRMQYGGEYKIEQDGDVCWFGPDFEEFYGDYLKGGLQEEDLLTLLG